MHAARRNKGFTLVELMASILISSVLMVAIGGVVANSHRQWNRMYRRVYGDPVVDAEIARRAFEATARRATHRQCLVDPTGQSITLFYYSDRVVAVVDRYAWFYVSGGQLCVEHGAPAVDGVTGRYIRGAVQGTVVLARNVVYHHFWQGDDYVIDFAGGGSQYGNTVRMVLTLDDASDGQQPLSITVSATRHND
ncbi:MAG: prepilin-type N-terminal cleavage/methylation domain-containing protein [Phycisphaerae bacterium]|nr:prepilin-type N-terminal cleavage/methylation domain-containing protein [Phycisphaerae bacterium]